MQNTMRIEFSYKEGLGIARFAMVLSSLSPLFVLWGVRGTSLFSDKVTALACVLLVILPNVFLFARYRVAKSQDHRNEITVKECQDNRSHLLVYLFAVLLPLYSEHLTTWRGFSAAVVALSFVIFIFWKLDLHYINIVFLLLGYRVFSIAPIRDDNPFSRQDNIVLITRRIGLAPLEQVAAYRLSNTVYLEATNAA